MVELCSTRTSKYFTSVSPKRFDVITSFSSGYIVGVGRVRTVTRATVTMTSQLGVLYGVTAGVLCT